MSRYDQARQAGLQRRLEQARTRTASGIPRRDGAAPPPLSFAQQRLWFLDQMVPGNPFYNIPAAWPLPLAVDQLALRQAWCEIVRRHEALRTTFVATPSGPCQRIVAPYDPLAPLADLSALTPAGRDDALLRLATAEARAPFDLAAGPLLRARLVRLEHSSYLLLMTVHHIVADGWSMGVLSRELMQLYAAYAQGQPSPLAPLPIQYADYAVWQRQALSPQRIDAMLRYWRAQLKDLPTLALVTDRPRPPIASFAGQFEDLAYDSALTAALEQLAHRHEATLFQVLLAGFMAVLSRFSGQTDIVVGAPIANRIRPELEGLIGFFVNTLVLRTGLEGDPDFGQIVRRVRRTAIDAYEQQDLPFEKLVEDLQPTRDLSRNPLAQVTFQLQNAPGALREKPAGLDQTVRIERASAIFDMAFSLWETGSGLVGGIEFATDVFDRASVRQLADALDCLLRAAVADERLPLSQLPLQTPAQRAATASLLQGAPLALPEQGLYQAFRACVEAAPGQVVLDDAYGVMTRDELLRQAAALAVDLRALGARSGTIVALALPRGRRFVAWMLATLQCGAAWLPLDPALPPQRRRRILELAQPVALIEVDQAWPPPAPPASMAAMAAMLESGATSSSTGAAPAYVLFTSGSSGVPKGVVVAQRALLNHMGWMRTALPVQAAGGRLLQRTPLHFDAAVWELWAPLLGDGVLLLPPPFEAADTGRLCAEVERLQASVLQLVPSLLRVLLDDPAVGRCASLRRLCLGGEAVDGALLAKARQRWPQIELVNLYGPTETTIDASWWVAPPHWPPTAPVPLGRPVANLRFSVLDQTGRSLPTGVIGELWIAGPQVADGYLAAGAAEAARFDRDADGRPRYRTGDLGWARHDGTLHYAGRADQQVKVHGMRVELGEVEAALAAHPAVQAAVAMAVADGECGATLVAFITLQADAALADLAAQAERHVDEWRRLYQSVYEAQAAAPDDPTFDTSGWISSYDGRPIGAPAMRAWLDATLARLHALRPRRVLEIGCGAGLIARGLAPRCQRYVGCDFSSHALERAGRALDARSAAVVRLVALPAHALDQLGEQGFDTAILNSVIQYFPDADYLLDVLRQALRLLAPGGRVFAGDIRDFGLLEAFHAEVQTLRAAPGGTPAQLLERLRAAVAQDKELSLAPAFFWRLPAVLPTLGRVAVRLKRGSVASEMLSYRYDVLLEAGAPPEPPAVAWHDWQRGGFTLAGLAHWLSAQSGPVMLAGLPNGRLSRAIAAAAALQLDAGAGSRAGHDATQPGVDPEALAGLAEAAGWAVELMPAPGQPFAFAALLHRNTMTPFEADAALLARQPPAGGRLTSNPLLATLGPALESLLKQHLAAYLPPALVPARIEPLAQLPLLASGKVDRAALAPMAARRASGPAAVEAPVGPLETLLAATWADVLRLKRVGASDRFFNDLGGHSLLATQVVSRLREALGIDLPLRLLFEHDTVRAMASAMLATAADSAALEKVAALVLSVNALDETALDQLLAQEGEQHA